jgi:hypothetical protein
MKPQQLRSYSIMQRQRHSADRPELLSHSMYLLQPLDPTKGVPQGTLSQKRYAMHAHSSNLTQPNLT